MSLETISFNLDSSMTGFPSLPPVGRSTRYKVCVTYIFTCITHTWCKTSKLDMFTCITLSMCNTSGIPNKIIC